MKTNRFIALLLALVLLAGGCGQSGTTTASSGAAQASSGTVSATDAPAETIQRRHQPRPQPTSGAGTGAEVIPITASCYYRLLALSVSWEGTAPQ